MSDMTIRPTAPQIPSAQVGDAEQAAATAAVGSKPGLGEADPAHIGGAVRKAAIPGHLPIDPPKGEQTPPAELKATLGAVATSAAADIYAVMALFQQMAQEMRTAAREDRFAEMQNKVALLGEAAQQIREAAKDRLTAACIQGSLQMAGGLMQMGTSGFSAFAGIKGAKASLNAADFKQQAKLSAGTEFAADFKAASAKMTSSATNWNTAAQTASGVTQGIGSLANGAGSIVSGVFQYMASEHDAQKAELEAQAQVAGHRQDQANELMQQMRDLIHDIQSKLSAMEQSSHDTAKSITRA